VNKRDLIRTLHESRDHGKDGSQLGDYTCNCAEYVDAIWPMIRAELDKCAFAAEYHQQAAYTECWAHRTTVAHDQTNRDRLDTLRRFAEAEEES